MSRLLPPLLLLLVALLGLLDWSGQRSRAARQASDLEAASPQLRVQPAAVWARPAFGGPPPPNPSPELLQRLRSWKLDPPELGGAELLDTSQVAAAAWVLLQDWLELTPGAGGRALRLELSQPAPEGPLQIETEFVGPPAAVLTWTRSLLAQPRAAGVLADPRRLRLTSEEGQLRALLIVRAWPADLLLQEAGE